MTRGELTAAGKKLVATHIQPKHRYKNGVRENIRHPRAPLSFRRTVLPPMIGILVTAGILGAMNGQLIAAQLHYRTQKPQTVAVSTTAAATPTQTDDTTAPDPTAGPLVHIPSIGVKAPIILEPGTAEWQIQLALRKGVVNYATTAKPGQPGNTVLFGHSSGQPWAPGEYKFVFTMLDKLKRGDTVQLDYEGTRYTYEVTGSDVVTPDQVEVLNQTADPTLTLITCTPVGTSQKRLVVHARLLRPLPQTAAQQASATAVEPAQTPVQAPQPAVLPDSAKVSPWQAVRDLLPW